jgi:hypothetical protein
MAPTKESTMDRKPANEIPEVPGIDLDYRPRDYFWAAGLKIPLLSGIAGATRRQLVRGLIEAGNPIPAGLDAPVLDEEMRQAWGRVHPSHMGGEFLPAFRTVEVEIARITIASVTQDVTSVYARRGKNRIHYRVVDEYEGDTLSGKNTRTSTRPLTLSELEIFVNRAWSIFDVLEMNFDNDGYDLNRMLRFVVGVESEFYSQIGELYERRIEAWAAVRRAELGMDPAEEQNLKSLIATGPQPRYE